MRRADAVVFVFEWTTGLQHGDQLDWARLLSAVPRRRRVVIDCDGRYNDAAARAWRLQPPQRRRERWWIDFCDSISDKIVPAHASPFAGQRPPVPLSPLRSELGGAAGIRREGEFDMVYVGHSKFRWHGMAQMLQAVEFAGA